MVGRNFLRVPGRAFQRGVSAARRLADAGYPGQRGEDAAGSLELFFGQITAVRTRIGR